MNTHTGKLIRQLAGIAFLVFLSIPAHGQILRISGAPSAGLPLKDAAEILKTDYKLTVQVSTEGGSSSWGISSLGLGLADIAMASRRLTAEDRAQYPDTTLQEIHFGEEVTSIVVSTDVWESGVRSISSAQAKAIYEGKIKNWKELGGADLSITPYTPDQSRGVWACYAPWIYDDLGKMRPNRFALVDTDDEAKANLEATPGSMSLVSMLYAQENHLHQLSIKKSDDKIVEPNVTNVANHTYPLTRPLMLVVKNRPLGDIKTVVDFVLSDRGQNLVSKYYYFTLKDLKEAAPVFE